MTPLPILDRETALSALGNDRETYDIVLETYLETTPDLLSQMKAALARSDMETLQRHAHSLKSSSRTIGALELGERAQGLESACHSQNPGMVGLLVEEVNCGFEELKKKVAD